MEVHQILVYSLKVKKLILSGVNKGNYKLMRSGIKHLSSFADIHGLQV